MLEITVEERTAVADAIATVLSQYWSSEMAPAQNNSAAKVVSATKELLSRSSNSAFEALIAFALRHEGRLEEVAADLVQRDAGSAGFYERWRTAMQEPSPGARMVDCRNWILAAMAAGACGMWFAAGAIAAVGAAVC